VVELLGEIEITRRVGRDLAAEFDIGRQFYPREIGPSSRCCV
jgi:hypothetical protein